MRRRQFLSLFAGAAVAPRMARAQETGRTYSIGCLIPVGRESPAIVAFFDELGRSGFVEGHNLSVLPGGFLVRRDQIAEKVAQIVKAAPDAIVSGPDVYTRAFQQATNTIPIIAMSEDMVADGLVTSMARPDRNTTGISIISPELDGKRQDLLIEAVPGARKIAALVDATRTSATHDHVRALQEVARARGIEVSVFATSTREQVFSMLDAAKAVGVQAVNFLASPLFTVEPRPIIEHVVSLRLPSIHQWPELAEAGGLIGYGARFMEVFRQRARLVARVLRGARPADLPVEQPTRFELVVNLKTAKTIGHEIPAGLVLRADKVIE
jgi:putative ABC transport system substrate-binding protein